MEKRKRSEKRKTTANIRFRCLPEEYVSVKALADTRGLAVGTMARRILFKAASLPMPDYECREPDRNAAKISKVLGQLGRIASSANQLARHANSTGTPAQSVMVSVLVDELKAVREELVREAR